MRVARHYQAQLRSHRRSAQVLDYLARRGIEQSMIERFGIGYAPADESLLAMFDTRTDRQSLRALGLLRFDPVRGVDYAAFRRRLMLPIADRQGRIIGFGGRRLGTTRGPKYLNSPDSDLFHKREVLYGLDKLMLRTCPIERLLVVEGYFDVISWVQHGLGPVLAPLGSALTDRHLEQLLALSSNLIFCFDGDSAGRCAAWRTVLQCLPWLGRGRQFAVVWLPQGDDPDTLLRRHGKPALLRCLAQAETLEDVLLAHFLRDNSLQGLEQRARLVADFKPILRRIEDHDCRERLIQRLVRLVGLPRLSALSLDFQGQSSADIGV